MESAEDNTTLTSTGAGTPMGELFRRFWIPVFLSQELPAPDCPPVRVKVLGEHLLGFRDVQGQVGLIEPRCSHRGADLFLGRNEAGGIRCVYHGLKFDVRGRCMEAAIFGDAFKPKSLDIKSYPVREWGEIIWAYLGPPGHMPPLPELEFGLVPSGWRYVTKKYQECNWLQALEGGIDPAHFSFLHTPAKTTDMDAQITKPNSTIVDQPGAPTYLQRINWVNRDCSPRIKTLEHDAGMIIAAHRSADDALLWRLTQMLMPSHSLMPNAFPGDVYHGNTWVPIDDHSCWIYCYSWHGDRPLSPRELSKYKGSHGSHIVHPDVGPDWIPVRNKSNDYGFDRVDQIKNSYTGIIGISEQDAAIQSSQGSIVDRTREHLAPTDLGIVRYRKMMMRVAQQLKAGTDPVAARSPASYRVRAGAAMSDGELDIEQVMLQRFGHELGRITSAQLYEAR